MKHARKDYDRFQDPAGLIPEDEPVLLLRGQDMCAPATLAFWAKEVRRVGGSEKIASMVEDWAVEMLKWQEKHGNKIPDLPE